MFGEWIYFENYDFIDKNLEQYCLITSKDLFKLYEDKLSKLKGDIKFVEDIVKNEEKELFEYTTLVAFGGGVVVDKTKYFSKTYNKKFGVIPSALSHDGICNSICVLKNDKHLSCSRPEFIIFDFNIIKNSGKDLLISGFCDVLAKKNSLQDCFIAIEKKSENFNNLALSFARSCYKIIEDVDNINFEDDFLRLLSESIILSGLSEQYNSNTKTVSGSEHLVCHAIDFLYHNNILHGIKVAYGCLLIEKLKNKMYKKKDNYYKKKFKKLGIYKQILKEFSFVEEDKVLKKALMIGREQNKFTFLEIYFGHL